jgi:Tfp pilus assembly protein PilN
MNRINLIPAHRRQAHRQGKRLRLWITAVCIYSLILGLLCAVTTLRFGGLDESVERQLLECQTRSQQLDSQASQLRRRLAQLIAQRNHVKALANQPDWSILLAALGSMVGNDTSLQEIRLTPLETSAKPPSTAPAGKVPGRQFRIELRGSSRSQPEMAQFVLRLQETGLFDEVKLVRSSRDPRAESADVNFELGCTIGDLLP